MLELIGSRYVIEHCISAFLKQQKEQAFHFYLTDCLQNISENTAKMSGKGASYVCVKYRDIVAPRKQNTRTSKDIINSIKNKLSKLGGDE